MGFIDEIKAKAKTSKKTIVLPETEDIRTYEVAVRSSTEKRNRQPDSDRKRKSEEIARTKVLSISILPEQRL